MTALVERSRCGRFLRLAISLLAMIVLMHGTASADGIGGGGGNGDGAGDGDIKVRLDETTLMKVPERTATVIIGNPLIADVTIQPGGLMAVNGRGYGVTNFIALDRSGVTLSEKKVVVKGADSRTVVVYRGVERNTYSCSPSCDPRVTLGDSSNFFAATLGQTGTWIGQVQGAAQMGRDDPDRYYRDRDRDSRVFRGDRGY